MLEAHVAALRAMSSRRDWVYSCGEEFALLHGVYYKPVPWTGEYDQGAAKMCYGNSILMAAMHGLRYVEGYALAPILNYAFPHAWNADDNGTLIDTTWCNTGLAYLGVQFSVERADDATWNGDASILDDYRRKWPLFRQPWTGENSSIVWPPSERLDVLRAGDRTQQVAFLMDHLDVLQRK